METKKVFKFFTLFEYEEEQEFLRKLKKFRSDIKGS